jgi:hypothetical protein
MLRSLVVAAVFGLLAGAPLHAQSGRISTDLQMAQDAQPFRQAADAFLAHAQAGDVEAAHALLSRALVQRMGEAAVRQALVGQILPFFQRGSGLIGSSTVTRTTDAAGQQGFAFYLWLQPRDGGSPRPFSLYVVAEGGRAVVANVVPDRAVEGRHR